MTGPARRDDVRLRQGLRAWYAERRGAVGAEVTYERPSVGWSNETLLVTVHGGADVGDRFVVRLPPPLPAYPSYDLHAQARILEALELEPVPAPRVVAFEEDTSWLGAPFLVTSYEPGRAGPEVPALDRSLLGASRDAQRRLHEAFLTTLSTIHVVDWRAHDLVSAVRGGEGSLAAEVDYWARYLEWACEGVAPAVLADAFEWCSRTVATSEPPPSLCWGDARIGNVLFSDDYGVLSVLDWELASIGPAEMDLGWYLSLDDLAARFTARTVPGFLERDQAIRYYERSLGRSVVDLPWHEIFALARSIAISERLARLAARGGLPYQGVAGDDNPMLAELARRIESL